MVARIRERLRLFASRDYRHILVTGFLVTYLAVALCLVAANLLTQRFDRALAESLFIAVMGYGYFRYRRTGDTFFGAQLSFWPPAVLIFFQMIRNDFSDFTVIYALLLPLASFFLFDFKRALRYTLLIFLLLSLCIFYARLHVGEHPYLHSPTALVNTFFGAMFVIAFGVFHHLSFYRSYTALQRANEQKEILLQEIHHRVKNNLNVIASIVGLQAINDDGRALSQLQHTKGRIESIAIVHEMLYKKRDDFAQIDFEQYIDKLSTLVETVYATGKVQRVFNGNGIALSLECMLDLGLITNELLTNTYKYAFAQTPEPVITVELVSTGPDTLRYRYHDNGCGVTLPESIDALKTLGLKLVSMAVRKLKGELSIESRDGLEIIVTFQKKCRKPNGEVAHA